MTALAALVALYAVSGALVLRWALRALLGRRRRHQWYYQPGRWGRWR